MKIKASAAGRVTLKVLKDGKVKKELKFDNIITSTGLAGWPGGPIGDRIAIGSGIRTETENITSLASYTRDAQGSYEYSPTNQIDEAAGVMYTNHRLIVNFPPETSPSNYGELGVYRSAHTSLSTYAYIKDEEGLPIQITVLTGEVLSVVYDIQFSTPLENVVTKSIEGVDTEIKIVPVSTGASYGARIPGTANNGVQLWESATEIAAGGFPAGVPEGAMLYTASWWPATGFQRWRLDLALLDANFDNGIGMMMTNPQNIKERINLLMTFDPPLPKNADNSIKMTITSNLQNGVFYEA